MKRNTEHTEGKRIKPDLNTQNSGMLFHSEASPLGHLLVTKSIR